ncbi:MAG: type III PLP-dependent enzyme [Paracoccaceae bacterium]
MSDRLLRAAERFGTPLYYYDTVMMLDRIAILRELFDGRFGISYAIKANPNSELLKVLRPALSTFDASSIAEVERALDAGMPAENITFSGPAKRENELRKAISNRVGELVIESLTEAQMASDIACELGLTQKILIRINPASVPRKFGASMAGTPSQFGIDEEDIAHDLPIIRDFTGLDLIGFHIYSGTNCLDAGAIAENIAIFSRIFITAQQITGIEPERLIFGSGFGVPYLPGEPELDHKLLPSLINPIIDELMATTGFSKASCTLELGRWLVARAGWLLTGVVATKLSRGVEIRMCDAGFNNHLAACGMMGAVIRRNWVFENITNVDGNPSKYMLVGPLCTSIDRLAMDVELPEIRVGDVIAIPSSGAYGLTASPTRFISHPDPREVLWDGRDIRDVSENLLNHMDTT